MKVFVDDDGRDEVDDDDNGAGVGFEDCLAIGVDVGGLEGVADLEACELTVDLDVPDGRAVCLVFAPLLIFVTGEPRYSSASSSSSSSAVFLRLLPRA